MVRTVMRRGERRLVIDFSFRKPDGSKGRYRHDAEVQTMAAAREEERRRLAALATTGSPFEVLDKAAREQVTPPKPASPTFAEVVKQYREVYLPTLKAATRYGYGVVIRTRLLPRFGALPIEQVDAVAVRAYEGALAREGLRPLTRRLALIVLRSIVSRFAVEAKLLPKAPELPKLPRMSKTAVLALTREQVGEALGADRYPGGIC